MHFKSCSFLQVENLVEVLVDRLKPTVIKKYEFEFTDMSTIIALFAIFGLSGFRRRD